MNEEEKQLEPSLDEQIRKGLKVAIDSLATALIALEQVGGAKTQGWERKGSAFVVSPDQLNAITATRMHIDNIERAYSFLMMWHGEYEEEEDEDENEGEKEQ